MTKRPPGGKRRQAQCYAFWGGMAGGRGWGWVHWYATRAVDLANTSIGVPIDNGHRMVMLKEELLITKRIRIIKGTISTFS